MAVFNAIRALVVVLALVSGLLMATGSVRARNVSGQAVFVAGWMLALVSSLQLVRIY